MQQKPALSTRKLIIIAIALVVGLLSIFIYKQSQFRVTSTTPDLSSFSSITPYMKINFNRVILDDDLRIADDPVSSIIDKKVIKGKTLTIFFKKSLEPETDYILTLTQIKSITGDVIEDKKLPFTAKNIDIKGLSKDQQRYLVDSQDQPIYEPTYLNYPGFDSLTDYGMTSAQLSYFKRTLFDYSNTVDKKYYTMKLLPESVVFTGRSRDNPTDTVKADFVLDLGGTNFQTHIEYELTSNAVRLRLVAPDGTIYDSVGAHDD